MATQKAQQQSAQLTRTPYAIALDAFKAQKSHILKLVKDQWCTPDWLFWAMAKLYGDNGKFDIDLFTDGQNAKAARFYTVDDNALSKDWAADLAGGVAFANPPYSRASKDHLGREQTGMVSIMKKARAERDKGARLVFLVKAATSETWWPQDAEKELSSSIKHAGADAVIFIRGRIAFDVPKYFVPATEKDKGAGAGFSGAIVIFDSATFFPPMSYVSRSYLERVGTEHMNNPDTKLQS